MWACAALASCLAVLLAVVSTQVGDVPRPVAGSGGGAHGQSRHVDAEGAKTAYWRAGQAAY